MTLVELRAIGKTFPGVRALHDVSLSIARGEVLGLVGENGAGKSTLIKILGGVYATYTGSVVVADRAVSFRSTRDARAAGIAVVHQELALVPEMSVVDNLVLGREPTRFGLYDHARARAMATSMLREVLGADASAIDLDAPISHLGVGVQQILEIARALADNARVIVLDEPTAALTDSEIERLFGLVRTRRAAGTSFVYISHRLGEIAALCDRVAVLRDGELVGVVAGSAPTDDIVTMMTGKELGDVHARRSRESSAASDANAAASARLSSSDLESADRVAARDGTHDRVEGAPVLRVRGLSVAHPALRDRRVVDNLSFSVSAGEVVALAGAMGAGRTATLSALFGVARSAVAGTILVDGREVRIATPRDAIAAGIAYVPEDRKGCGLVLDASVADNLALASLDALSSFGLVDGARAEQRARSRVADMAIKVPSLDAEVSTLSGGNQQKIVIGKWLERAPRVLLLDEPTRGVDVGAKAEIYRLIEALTAKGHAVVIASSDLPEVLRLADRVLVLREGRLAGELAGDEVTQLAIMQLAVGSADTTRVPAESSANDVGEIKPAPIAISNAEPEHVAGAIVEAAQIATRESARCIEPHHLGPRVDAVPSDARIASDARTASDTTRVEGSAATPIHVIAQRSAPCASRLDETPFPVLPSDNRRGVTP
ncbi:MAG: sugar ABC transporter ATP-binding protein [Kofleriaceae bacterium]